MIKPEELREIQMRDSILQNQLEKMLVNAAKTGQGSLSIPAKPANIPKTKITYRELYNYIVSLENEIRNLGYALNLIEGDPNPAHYTWDTALIHWN